MSLFFLSYINIIGFSFLCLHGASLQSLQDVLRNESKGGFVSYKFYCSIYSKVLTIDVPNGEWKTRKGWTTIMLNTEIHGVHVNIGVCEQWLGVLLMWTANKYLIVFFYEKKKSNKLTEWRKSNKTLLTEWLRAVISIKINICALRTYRRRTCNAREVSTRIGFRRWRPFKTKIFINMVSMEMLLGGLFKWLMHLALCCFLCFYCQCCFFYLSLPWPVTYVFKKLHSMLSFYFVLFIFRRHVKQISAELRLCTKTHEGDRRPGSLHTISPGIELLTTFTLHLTFHLEISSALISGS